MAAPASHRHSGRPRDPAIDQAVLAATLAVLHERGYSGFSMEAVASRAGTAKTSIARRWPRRQALIISALSTVVDQPAVPDTGCTRCDLIDGIEMLATAVLKRMPPGVLAPLIADCAGDSGLHEHLVDSILRPARDALATTVGRAIDRGHLRPEIDTELVVDLLASVVFQSSVFADGRFDVGLAVNVVDLILQGIAVDFDELLAISRGQVSLAHRHPV